MTHQDEERFDCYLTLLRASGSIDTVLRRWPEISDEARDALEMADVLYRSRTNVPPHRLSACGFINRLEHHKPSPFKQVFSWFTP